MKKNHEIEISKTNKGKEQIILNRKYKYGPSFIILNNENQILEYDDSHNHLEKNFEAAK
ncbi:hypothetical protein H8356DRAFT_1337929 [Neocallimastix lanati (nom. inval.)]|nr:hypothetical protein H8356DRAFT_1337929 [Neocallimastix sp. JGI-2020a]